MNKITNLLIILASGLAFAQTSVSGYVYEDTNKNNIKDRKEKGLANVSVSNGVEVVQTDANGRYSLPHRDNSIYFVIKPSGYATPVGADQLPKFYYISKPNGSPANLKYKGSAPTAPLPAELNFPIYRQNESKDFRIVVFGDPQPYDLKELDYFKRGVVQEVKNNPRNSVFGISLGDLVGNDLTLHQPYIQTVKEIALPWYNIIGNHDMNMDATDDTLSDETFESNFGPANYSFNYGNVHFIMLDDILFPDPRGGKGYWGGFREDQLKFVENDLKTVGKDKLIMLCFHIQLKPENARDDHFRMTDRQRLFDLLQPFPNVLMVSGHTHKQSQLFYSKQDGWQGAEELLEYNAGTTSGDWYSGTISNQGVPSSTMRDGTYRGYSFIDFKDNKFKISYKAAGLPEDFQINLFVPKSVPQKGKSYSKVFANFFMGSEKDTVEYRIDGGAWKPMAYTETVDPAYTLEVLQWDTTEKLFPGRRPNNPESSRHVWQATFPKNLKLGNHTVEVRAQDRYGQTFTSEKKTFNVQEGIEIP